MEVLLSNTDHQDNILLSTSSASSQTKGSLSNGIVTSTVYHQNDCTIENSDIFHGDSSAASNMTNNITSTLGSMAFEATLPVQQSLYRVYDILDNSVNSTKNYYEWLRSFSDPRVEDWPMMSSPGPTLIAFTAYLLIANYGPTLMKSRKPFQLRWLLVVYNLYIALLNLWIASELLYCAYKLKYRSVCQLVIIDKNPYVMRIANGVWWYFASKGFEFADTLFFILRKKDRQLTFLHKYHHSSMFLVWWTVARFVPGGSVVGPIVVNSLVHVLMYGYYGLAAVGPSMQKYLWWKKHLTRVQLVQFFLGVLIGSHMLATGCQFTRWMLYVFIGYATSFIVLFGNFYLNEYTKKRDLQTSEASANGKQKEL